jgi:hypothetical protein
MVVALTAIDTVVKQSFVLQRFLNSKFDDSQLTNVIVSHATHDNLDIILLHLATVIIGVKQLLN